MLILNYIKLYAEELKLYAEGTDSLKMCLLFVYIMFYLNVLCFWTDFIGLT